MEKLNYKYQTLLKAQAAFERSLKLYKNPTSQGQAELEAYTASVIKHFELFFETLWKYLKLFLSQKYGIEAVGSKTIFRACSDTKLITANELEDCLETVEIRNNTTHVYDELQATELSEKIITHYAVLKKLLEATRVSDL